MQGTFYYNITHICGETNIHTISVYYSLDIILICYYSHTGKYYEHTLSVNYMPGLFLYNIIQTLAKKRRMYASIDHFVPGIILVKCYSSKSGMK